MCLHHNNPVPFKKLIEKRYEHLKGIWIRHQTIDSLIFKFNEIIVSSFENKTLIFIEEKQLLKSFTHTLLKAGYSFHHLEISEGFILTVNH